MAAAIAVMGAAMKARASVGRKLIAIEGSQGSMLMWLNASVVTAMQGYQLLNGDGTHWSHVRETIKRDVHDNISSSAVPTLNAN
jgi:hypothetical protein